MLLANDVRTKVPFVPRSIAVLAKALRKIQNDGDGEAMIFTGQFDQRLAGLGLHIRGVDHGQPAQSQALTGDVVQKGKSFVGHGLVVFVVTDHPPASV